MFELKYLSDSRLIRAGCWGKEPLWGRLKDYCVSFITRNNAIKPFQIVGLVYGYAQLLHLKRAGIVDHVAGHDRLRVITGEAVIRIHRWRNVIDHVTWRDCDFERVCVARWSFEFDGKFPRFFCFQKSPPPFGR